MAAQERLLEQQLAVLANSPLKDFVLRGRQPRNSAEMREQLPLTTYADYEIFLGQKRDDLHPEQPTEWIRTSGRSGSVTQKWYPISPAMAEETRWIGVGLMLMATAGERGQVNFRPNSRVLNMLASPPYASGAYFRPMFDLWPARLFPPDTPEVDAMEFPDRTALAMSSAITHGVDVVVSMAPILAAIGEGFAERRPRAPCWTACATYSRERGWRARRCGRAWPGVRSTPGTCGPRRA